MGEKKTSDSKPRMVTADKPSAPKEHIQRMGRRIRALRTGNQLTQEQLAEKAGVSQKYLGEIERGIGNVTIDILNSLAEALNVPLSSVLENDHEQTHDALVGEIVRMAPLLSMKDAQIVYRMLTLLTGK